MKKDQASQFARLLRQIADILEQDPTYFEIMAKQRSGKAGQSARLAFDPFRILSEEGPDALKARLSRLTQRELKVLIQDNRLDPSRLSAKWTDREKLVELAFDRLMSRSKHGSVFLREGLEESSAGETT